MSESTTSHSPTPRERVEATLKAQLGDRWFCEVAFARQLADELEQAQKERERLLDQLAKSTDIGQKLLKSACAERDKLRDDLAAAHRLLDLSGAQTWGIDNLKKLDDLTQQLAAVTKERDREQELNYGLDCMALTAKNAKLTARVAELEKEVVEDERSISHMAKHLREAKADFAALRADKERLDWLESMNPFIQYGAKTDSGTTTRGHWCSATNPLRTAIDKARAT